MTKPLIRVLGISLGVAMGYAALSGSTPSAFATPCQWESRYYCIRVDPAASITERASRLMALDHLVHSINDERDPDYFATPYVHLVDEIARRKFDTGQFSAFFVGGGGYTLPRGWLSRQPEMRMRPILGVRTASNTFGRMLNPFAAPCQVQGVFHPNYLSTHCAAAVRLGQRYFAAFKGGGGEVQRNPEKPCLTVTLRDGKQGEETWPAMADGARYPWRREPLVPAQIEALWRGEYEVEAPIAAVIGTAAIALRVLGQADTPLQAQQTATDMAASVFRAHPAR